MKKIISLFIAFIIILTSCKNETTGAIENSAHTDSLMKVLNSPELVALNKKILDNPNDAGLYNERSKLYLKYKQLEDAIYDAKRCILMDSTKAEFYINEADVFFAANQTRNAKDILEKVVVKFPENTEGLLKLGELFYLVKQYENAFAKINQALKINVNLSKAYYLKGNIYKEMGDTAKAISSLETAIEQDNKNYGAFLDLGLIYASRKNTIALDYYDNALSVNPTAIDALYAKAMLLQNLEKTDDAILIYNIILKLDSAHVNSMYNIGAIEFGFKKNTQKAMDYFTQAINFDPKYAEAYFARGACYQELKNNEKAKADYQMALQLKPNYEPALEGLNSL